MPSALRTALVLALTFACAAWTATPPAAQPATQRVVAVGDVHGAAREFASILESAGLIDAQRKWIGGRARLVQTGDFLDRGGAVREVMELLIRLEDEARRAGGRVDVLMGNHEGMNLLRDVRDVSPEAYKSFADRDSESRRARGFNAHATIARRAGEELNRNDWLRDHPPGYIEYIDALGPSGRFGRWLRSRKVVAKVDDSVFMHAGIPLASTASLDDINRTVEREVRGFDDVVAAMQRAGVIAPFFTLQEIVKAGAGEINRIAALLRDKQELTPEVTQQYVTGLQRLLTIDQWTLLTAEGPLWYRGYATLGDEAQPQVEALLKRLGAVRFVTGHTPQIPGRITPRLGNRVFLIDTGMLTSHFKRGRPSALEIAGGRLTALYADEKEAIGTGTRD